MRPLTGVDQHGGSMSCSWEGWLFKTYNSFHAAALFISVGFSVSEKPRMANGAQVWAEDLPD